MSIILMFIAIGGILLFTGSLMDTIMKKPQKTAESDHEIEINFLITLQRLDIPVVELQRKSVIKFANKIFRRVDFI